MNQDPKSPFFFYTVKCYDNAHNKDYYREPEQGLSLTKTTKFKQLQKPDAPKPKASFPSTHRFSQYNKMRHNAQLTLEQLCQQVSLFDPVKELQPQLKAPEKNQSPIYKGHALKKQFATHKHSSLLNLDQLHQSLNSQPEPPEKVSFAHAALQASNVTPSLNPACPTQSLKGELITNPQSQVLLNDHQQHQFDFLLGTKAKSTGEPDFFGSILTEANDNECESLTEQRGNYEGDSVPKGKYDTKKIRAMWHALLNGTPVFNTSPYGKTNKQRKQSFEQGSQALSYIDDIATSLEQDGNLEDIFSILCEFSSLCQSALEDKHFTAKRPSLLYTLELLEQALKEQSSVSNYLFNFLGSKLKEMACSYTITTAQLAELLTDFTYKCTKANNLEQRKELFFCFIEYLNCFKSPEAQKSAPQLFEHHNYESSNELWAETKAKHQADTHPMTLKSVTLHNKLNQVAANSINLALSSKHNLAFELMQPNSLLDMYLREDAYTPKSEHLVKRSHADAHLLLSQVLTHKGLNKTELNYYLGLQKHLQIASEPATSQDIDNYFGKSIKGACKLLSDSAPSKSLETTKDTSLYSVLNNDFSYVLLEHMVELYFKLLSDKGLIYHECYKLPLVNDMELDVAVRLCNLLNEHCHKSKVCYSKLVPHDDYIELHAYFKKNQDYHGYQRINDLLSGATKETYNAPQSLKQHHDYKGLSDWQLFLKDKDQEYKAAKIHFKDQGGNLIFPPNFKHHASSYSRRISYQLSSFVNFCTCSLMSEHTLDSESLRYNPLSYKNYHTNKKLDITFAGRNQIYQGSINFFLAVGVQDAIEHLAAKPQKSSSSTSDNSNYNYNALYNPKVPSLSLFLYVLDALERQEAFIYQCNCGATNLVINPYLMSHQDFIPCCKQCHKLLNFITHTLHSASA